MTSKKSRVAHWSYTGVILTPRNNTHLSMQFQRDGRGLFTNHLEQGCTAFAATQPPMLDHIPKPKEQCKGGPFGVNSVAIQRRQICKGMP